MLEQIHERGLGERIKLPHWVRVEVHLLKTILDEVKKEWVLCVQGHRQTRLGHVSAVSLTCINVTETSHNNITQQQQLKYTTTTGRTT